MINNTTYKQTAIGLIPEDWEVKKLGEIAEIKGGKRLPKGESLVDENTGFPYIRVTDMYLGGVDISKILFVPKHIEPLIKNYKISKDDLFITVAGTIGLVGEIPNELDNANLTENANKITVKESDKKYILYTLCSDLIQNIIIGTTTKNAQPKLALERIRDLKIPLPPLPEQQKIASILSTWDSAIDNCKAIIEELKVRNKGLAQQLLTGKMRVKGFEESKWKTLKLGKLGSVISGLTYSPDDINENEGVLVLRSSNIQDKKIDMKSTVYVKIKNGQFNPVLKDDILICVRNGSRNLIGKNLLIPKELEGVAFGAFMSVFRSEYNSYLIHLFDSVFYYKEIEKNLGATINSINGSDLKNFKFPFPTLEEQKAIANILDKATQELTQYQQKLQSLQLQKKGLMQQLLTGKVRVKV